MKEVKLVNVSTVGKTHSVYLGNGTINRFSSLRDAKQFLAQTNNFLTDKLHAFHKTYVEVWNHYQANWFYLDNGRKTNKADFFALERELVAKLNNVSFRFDLIVQRCGFINGNFFAFTHFFSVADELESVIRSLSELYSSHDNANAIYIMDQLIFNIMYARNELNNYGKRSTTKLFKIPTHISEDKSYIPELAELRVA
ncbi:MAG TPA: hypothetical protein VGC65_00390 [Bacteroidia bacterium]|jgi:hypothetical protein